MTRFLIFFFCIILQSAICQEDYTLYYKRLYYADKLLAKKQWDKAIIIYDSLIKNYKYSKEASSCAGTLSFKKGNFSKASIYFLKLASLGVEYDDLGYSSFDCDLCFTNKNLYLLEDKVPTFRRSYIVILGKLVSGYNREFDESLKSMLITDQAYRADFNISESDPNYKQHKKIINQKRDEVDSLNLIELKRLIKKYGCLPIFPMVSQKSLLAFTLILTHNSTVPWCSKYCDTLLKQVRVRFKNGNCIPPLVFANIIDRKFHHIYNQNYYCQFYDKELSIFEPESLNARRAEIFLQPIEQK